jgi:hypothetical protein
MNNSAADSPAVAEQLPHVSLPSGSEEVRLPELAGLPVSVTDQETDLWWDSYSGWTMLPSFLVCLGLTALIFWLVLRYLPHRELAQATILGASGAVWLAQLTRWGFRFFGYSYRLTTRRLFHDVGFRYSDRQQVDLAAIADVRVERKRLDSLIGVGRLKISFVDSRRPPLILEGLRQPERAAELIRQACKKVRQGRSAEVQ